MLSLGWATRDFTPTRPAMLQGQMHTRVARSAKDPLTLTALAVSGGQPADHAIIISADLPFISETMLAELRAQLATRLPEVAGAKLLMTATHTHTAPVTEDGFYIFPGGDVMPPPECRALIVGRAADAAVAAWQACAPQAVARGFGHAVVGHNRRAIYADGLAQMYGSIKRPDFTWIEGYEDHSLDLLFTWDVAGKLTGVAVAIPCPSQVDEGLEVFSADYWHEVRVELRRRFGADLAVLPLCAAAGDQSPHFLLYAREEAEMRRRRGVTERQEIAQRVGDAMARALACTPPPPVTGATPFAHRVQQLTLTPRRVSRPERDWAAAEFERAIKQRDPKSWWPECLKAVVETGDGTRTPPPFTMEMHALRLGELGVVTNPFELFVDYGLRIKARSPAPQTAVIQLAAGPGWYLPTERAVRGGGYGAMPAVCKVGPEGGQELVEHSLQALAALFPA